MSAIEELEQFAVKHAQEAVALDRQGKRDQAIIAYQKAIDCLLKLVSIYPNHNLSRIYIQRAEIYRSRVQYLQEYGLVKSSKEERVSYESIEATHNDELEDLIIKEPPNVKLDEVVGLEDAKRTIMETIVYPSIDPKIFPLGWPKGILFFGPPGCGKTLLAAAVANEIKATFISVDAASIMSKWLGEAEKNVARVFRMARKAAASSPAIIFIDEVDSLMGTHRLEVGGETRMRNQFLKEMDGIIDKNNHIRVYVIGSTNKPWTLDSAFIRRFQKRIYVPPPDFSSRLRMFKLYTGYLRISRDVNLEELAMRTEGFSGSDIMDICQSAQLKVNSELFESGMPKENMQPREITMADFLRIIEKRKPSISKELLSLYEKWYNEFGAL
ncbi:MAG: AAA family ATPase [Nitrososphaerota archaeon]|nr:AAA family ATPase [Candidatus Bathyarchaeota archaeon]MDW8048546.1 AAA family ATPase [Nitrososphaerota archaeon]